MTEPQRTHGQSHPTGAPSAALVFGLAITMQIPGYDILEKLGEGGMAAVYSAIQRSLGRIVVLKVISPVLAREQSFRERFLKEGRVLAKLKHPHIVVIHDIGEAQDHYYMAMEFIEGGTLSRRIQRGLAPEQAIAITRQLTQALGHAHKRGIIHRDVKPSNILFREEDAIVLSDFGIAKGKDDGHQLTQTGLSVGTPSYMSPEQFAGRDLDGRADLYSVGVVLHEMLTGQRPYTARDGAALMWKHLQEPIPRLPSPLAYLQPLLERLLAKDRENRFQDAEALVRELDDVGKGDGGKQVPTRSPALPSSTLSAPIAFEEIGGAAADAAGAPAGTPSSNPALWPRPPPHPVALSIMALVLIALMATYVAFQQDRPAKPPASVPVNDEPGRPAALGLSGEHSPAPEKHAGRAARGNDAAGGPEITPQAVEARRQQGLTAEQTARVLGVWEEDRIFQDALRTLREAEEQRRNGAIAAAEQSYREAIVAFDKAKSTSARVFLAGSYPQEAKAAKALCQHDNTSCDEAQFEDERVRNALLTPFEIDRHEVTNEQFAEFVEQTGYNTAAETLGFSLRKLGPVSVRARGYSWRTPDGPGSSYADRPRHPVVSMSRNDAVKYCAWRGSRLPTEDEWEFAARGSERRAFPWGRDWDPKRLRWGAKGGTPPEPVGSFPSGATPEGIQDLSGGVWEWTSSTAEAKGILKGGSWLEVNPANLRPATRRLSEPSIPNTDDGFRCARDTTSWLRRKTQ